MRIRSVRIRSFGPFSDQTLDLSQGMTVIVGDNESGKSSWHAAIFAALCGLRRGQGRRIEDREFTRRHRPWDGSGWSVEARLELADGRVIDIVQDLDGQIDCRAVDLGLGRRDVSHEIMFDGSPDASQWLGLDRRTFLATACIGQADVLEILKSAGALQEHLQRAAATAGADETAARALSLLEDFQKERVGQDRTNSVKPLRRAMVAVEAAVRALEAAQADHDRYLQQLEALVQLEAKAGQARRVQDVLEAAAALYRAEELERAVARARELASQLQGEPIDLETVQKAANQVSGAIAAWNSAPAPEPLVGPTSSELDRELSELPAAPVGDLSPSPAIIDADTKLEAARQALPAHLAARPEPALALPTELSAPNLREIARDLRTDVPAVDPKLQDEHATLERRLAATPERRVSVPLLIAAGLAAAAAAIGGFLTTPLLTIAGLAVAAGLVAVAVRHVLKDPRAPLLASLRDLEARLATAEAAAAAAQIKISEASARAQAIGLPAEPGVLESLARKVDEITAAVERLRQWETTRSELESRTVRAEAALRAALIERGIEDTEDCAAAVAKYREDCAARARVAQQAARRPQLERELETRRRAEAAADATKDRHDDAEAELVRIAREEGLDAVDAAGAFAALITWQETNGKRLVEAERQAEARGELGTLLAGRSEDELVREAERTRRRAEAATADLPADEVEAAVHTPGLDLWLEAARREAEAASVAAAGANGELKQFSSAPADVSAREEALAAARRELDRVRQLDATLTRTREFLEQAQERVHRDIAPVLERTLRDWLPRVTGGRYTDGSIDPETLEILVKDPSGKFREAGLLSQGTREQIYLLLRMALVKHLTKRGEVSPLIFDDVTVQTDSVRTGAILDLLHEMANDHQVIVFSQEEDVRHWSEAHLGGDHALISLNSPAAQSLPD